LTRSEDTTRTRWEGEEETWAEGNEESGGHDEIGLGKNKTHSLGNEAEHEEEHESVEEHGHLVGLAVHELDVPARGGDEHTGAECKKKGSWYSDFLGSDIGEHLIYTHIIFSMVNKVVECGTSHHLIIESIVIDHAPEISPNIGKSLFIPLSLFL
jgi:hypothetical protein